MKLRPHQETARNWLLREKNRLLGDEQRVGKTGAALMAVKDGQFYPLLIVCPVSAIPGWLTWIKLMGIPGRVAVNDWTADVCIVPWSKVSSGALAIALRGRGWALLILDESHYAKSFGAARTRAVYGTFQHDILSHHKALANRAERVWCLTGTPIPHDPSDLFPMMRTLFQDTLAAKVGHWPEAMREYDFLTRYVIRRKKQISAFNSIWVNMGGRNEAELGRRLGDNMLRRRQKDVGIYTPVAEPMPLQLSAAMRKQVDGLPGMKELLADIDKGGVSNNPAIAAIRHITGDLKAKLMVPLVKDYFDDTGDKLVLAYWHKSVGDHLQEELVKYQPVRVDGSVDYTRRGQMFDTFQKDPNCRLCIAQIEAAGQGVDLSAAPELWFVESTFSPRQMSQMQMRIANMNATRQGIVRVASLAGSIDEAIQTVLIRLINTIEKVLED